VGLCRLVDLAANDIGKGEATASCGSQALPTTSSGRCSSRVGEDPNVIYFDKLGLITQRNGDGGDTAQREGMFWLASWVRDNVLHDPWTKKRQLAFASVMKFLELAETGTFWRHPVQWNNPKDFSRDQTIPVVAAMGVHGDTDRYERFYRELRRRNWTAQNGDVMWDPLHRNLVRRGRNEEVDVITDGASLFAAAQSRIAAAALSKDDVGDDLNLIVIMLLAAVKRPTAGSTRAREFYSKNRPTNYGMFLGAYRVEYGTDWSGQISPQKMRQRMDEGIKKGWSVDCPRVLGALRWYFRAETGGSPGIAQLFEPIIRRWFE